MGLLPLITGACDRLTATMSPTVDALGVHIIIALATIMLVWFGVQEALASASGGPGFSMGNFLNFFMLATFAYAMIAFYDSSIPGIGYSLKGFINGGAQYLVTIIGNDSVTQMQNALGAAQSSAGPGLKQTLLDPYFAIVFFFVQLMLALFSATLIVIVGYGAVAMTVVAMFGPIMIPFMVVPRLEFLFWCWLRAYIGFCFYKVVAAAIVSVLASLLTNYYTTLASFTDPGLMVKQLPLLIILVFLNLYMLFQVPHLTLSIFSGSTGGHGGGMGGAAAALLLRG